MKQSVLFALFAAALFGAAMPFAKRLLGNIDPLLLAGLLYLGSGLGLTLARVVRDHGWKASNLPQTDRLWLVGAICFGGVLAPIALLFGLKRIDAGVASLLLNLEAVLTALLAWLVFSENADRRVVVGMAAIVIGGIVLSSPTGPVAQGDWSGPALVALACLCWAIDNNFTRKVASADALFVAGGKGVIAGITNTLLATAAGTRLPSLDVAASALLLGLAGYGISLVLFVLALRGLGAARTGAYFSTAPFIGAAISVVWLGETTSPVFWIAGVLMAVGVWLHLTEHHEHEHSHEALVHSHRHTHDEHHQHAHDEPVDLQHPHEHVHAHAKMKHSHAHYPDIHHQHDHGLVKCPPTSQ